MKKENILVRDAVSYRNTRERTKHPERYIHDWPEVVQMCRIGYHSVTTSPFSN
jgi:hypothetical protein